jgi:hypothetical protein
MALDSAFVQTIEYPEHPVLEEALAEACDKTVKRLNEMGFTDPDQWLIRKVACAYFYDWEQDSPDFAFVLPDPGNVGKGYTQEIRGLQKDGPDIQYSQQIEFYRKLARDWFLKHRTDFPNEFFPILRSNGLIEYSEDWKHYVRNNKFFDDFYMTDIIKYRVGGNSNSEEKKWAFQRQLKQELTEIDPAIIFVFGKSAWNTIRTYLNPTSVNTSVKDDSKITKAHGKLYYTNTHICAFVVPLSHMSGNSWWQFPPEEYTDKLETVLTELQETAERSFHPPNDLCDSKDRSGDETTVLDEIAEEIGEVSEF